MRPSENSTAFGDREQKSLFFPMPAIVGKVHAGSIMATDLVNLSNELAGTVERAASGIVAIHARRGIGCSGIVWRDNLILTSSEGVRAEEGDSGSLCWMATHHSPIARPGFGYGSCGTGNGGRRSSSFRSRVERTGLLGTACAGRGANGKHRTNRILRNHQRRFRRMENLARRKNRSLCPA